MAEPAMHAAASRDRPEEQDLDQLQANLLMLMSQYTLRPCPHVVSAIVDHIGRLYNHPMIDLVPAQKDAVARLSRLWCSRLPLEDRAGLH